MMKKIVIALVIILIILAATSLIVGSLNNRSSQQQKSSPSPTGISADFPASIMSDEEFTKTRKAITLVDQEKLDRIKEEPSYEGENFYIEKGEESEALTIYKNTPEAEEEIDKYLESKGISKIDYKNSNSIDFVDLSDNDSLDTEDKDEEIDLFSGSSTEENKDLQLLTDLLKTLLTLELEETPETPTAPQPTPTPEKEEALPILTGLLPKPLPADLSEAAKKGRPVVSFIKRHPSILSAYKQAARETDLPWQILAALHYREGMGVNKSLVSGRKIGDYEPDIPKSRCRTGKSGLGIPIRVGPGCGFRTFADSVVYAAKHLRGKVGGKIDDFRTLVTAVSRYNGGGNRNCGRAPYSGCPRSFYGEDDPYAMNFFDKKHKRMYIVYCADHTRCNPPKKDPRPGVVSMFKYLVREFE